MKRLLQFIWMFLWETVFVLFILPWAWLPIVLSPEDERPPRWMQWVWDQASGKF